MGIVRSLALAAMLVAGLTVAATAPAAAQVDVGACGAYSTQEQAQEELDANPELAETLDGDGNGIACDGLPSRDDPQVDVGLCGTFETQEDAQAELDENPDLVEMLDGDGNGVACDGLPSRDPDDDQVDVGLCGTFSTQEDAQAYLDANPEDADQMDNDGNGIACEDLPSAESGESDESGAEDSVTPAPASGGTLRLPNTGAGPAHPVDGPLGPVTLLGTFLAALLMVIVGARTLRMPRA